MIKITSLLNIWETDKIPEYIAESMEKQMLKICKDYLTLDISSFGAFYFIENVNDLDRYAETGMTERIENAEPEFLNILNNENDDICYHTCYIVSDMFAIYVYCEDKILRTLNHQDTQNNF